MHDNKKELPVDSGSLRIENNSKVDTHIHIHQPTNPPPPKDTKLVKIFSMVTAVVVFATAVIGLVNLLLPKEPIDEPIDEGTVVPQPSPNVIISQVTDAPTPVPSSIPIDQLYGWDGKDFQYAYLGVYPQGANGEVEPILWQIIHREKETRNVLLQSSLILEYRTLNEKYIKKYSESSICTFLNNGFLKKAFSAKEASDLRLDRYLAPIRIVKNAEIKEHPPISRVARASEYVLQKYQLEEQQLFYWTIREEGPGHWSKLSVYDSYGFSDLCTDGAYFKIPGGVRPAMMLSSLNNYFNAGDGTAENPFYRIEE